jgi:cyclohexyl-isocyanide hydratase
VIAIGIIIFPQVEELDFVGPFEVLTYTNKIMPGSVKVLLVAETLEPVRAFNGLRVLPDTTFRDCPPLDVIIAPGGKGRLAAMKDPVILDFIRKRQESARYIASVCTGAFLLAAAGLLDGKKATTYHTALNELAGYSVEVVKGRKVVKDGAVITAAGVSSGIELGLCLVRLLFGPDMSWEVAERIEYAVDVAAL